MVVPASTFCASKTITAAPTAPIPPSKFSRGGELTRQDQEYVTSISEKPITYVLTAGDSDQKVLDGGYLGHSVFAGHLIRLLEGVGDFMTASEISPRIRRHVSTEAHKLGHQQTPVYGAIRGQGDYVFLPVKPDEK